MHIAVCDDDSSEFINITAFLNAYREEKNIMLTYKTYQSAVELLSNMKSGLYDLLLLDILMPGFSGIQAAHEVRSFDSGVKIIFLTSSPEFALESYEVKALDYMLKPVTKAKLFSALDVLLAEEQESLEGILIKTQSGIVRILFSKLTFLEVRNKHLFFNMSDGSVREVHATLAEYEGQLLARREFVKTHRSYIVNLWHMSELTTGTFITNRGDTIPISRLLYNDMRKAYLDHLFTDAVT